MLIKLRDTQKDFAEEFAVARADSNPETDAHVVHNLKSNAGNIGAKAVQIAAAKLEVACMEKAPAKTIDELLDKVLAELKVVIDVLEKTDI